MSDDSVSTVLLSVGIISIIILSAFIVWLIIYCERRRKASYRFSQLTEGVAHKPPDNIAQVPVNNASSPALVTEIQDKNENLDDKDDFMTVPLHEQITAIFGSFPNITDYKPLDDSDTESTDAIYASLSFVKADSDCSLPTAPHNNIDTAKPEQVVNAETTENNNENSNSHLANQTALSDLKDNIYENIAVYQAHRAETERLSEKSAIELQRNIELHILETTM